MDNVQNNNSYTSTSGTRIEEKTAIHSTQIKLAIDAQKCF
jgi:hypothetical protein